MGKRKASPSAWKKGKSGNPNGRGRGVKAIITEAKIRVMARTGMLPLDFLTAVYRNQLYEDYEERMAEDGKTIYFTPKKGAKRIHCEIMPRLAAASTAAPYIHKKMPVGIEMGNRNAAIITAEKLRGLTNQQLEVFLELLGRLGIGAEFEGFEHALIEGTAEQVA